MQTPRTGKRSKKAKEKRRQKQMEETLADEVKRSSAERGEDPAVPGGESSDISADPAKIESQDCKTEEGSTVKPCATGDVKDQQQSDVEGNEKEEEEREMEDKGGEGEGKELEGEMEEEGEELGVGESDSDDDAPEDITLAKGKTMALEKQKDEGEQIKR